MKKSYLLIAFFSSVAVSAQFDNAFGVKAGANYSQFRPDFEISGVQVLDFQGKIGYYIGGFFNVGLSEKLSVRPELLFANQGTRTSSEISIEEVGEFPTVSEVVTNWNEIMILLPINLRYELLDRFSVEVGLQPGYAVKRTSILKKFPFEPSLEGQKEAFSDFDRFDLALNGGIGFDLTDKLELQCRYSYGVIERDNEYKTSVISLGVGVKIL